MTRFAPRLKLLPEVMEIDTFKLRAERRKFRVTLFQQRVKSGGIVPRVVMKSCRHLNKPVEERLALTDRIEPNGFKSFVGLKVLPGVEQADSPSEVVFHDEASFLRERRAVQKGARVNFTHCAKKKHVFRKSVKFEP